MTTRVIALGGSLLRPEEKEARATWLGRFRQMAVHLEGMDIKLALVVGGGAPAREGIELAKHCITNPDRLDTIGIKATRLNATILQQIMLDIGSDVAEVIPTSTDEAKDLLASHKFVVMGGTMPGHTTDTVAVELASKCEASRAIIATNVAYVYDSDPRENINAVPLKELTLQALSEIIGDDLTPGASTVVDPIAVTWAAASNLEIAVLDGRDFDRIEAAIEGQPFEGTIIRTD